MYMFPVMIQSLFEEKSTGVLRATKPITDTVIKMLLAYKQTAFSE